MELAHLIHDLLALGFSEDDIARRIGMTQASVNRIKLGRQKNVRFGAVDALRDLHRERFPEKYRLRRPAAAAMRA